HAVNGVEFDRTDARDLNDSATAEGGQPNSWSDAGVQQRSSGLEHKNFASLIDDAIEQNGVNLDQPVVVLAFGGFIGADANWRNWRMRSDTSDSGILHHQAGAGEARKTLCFDKIARAQVYGIVIRNSDGACRVLEKCRSLQTRIGDDAADSHRAVGIGGR